MDQWIPLDEGSRGQRTRIIWEPLPVLRPTQNTRLCDLTQAGHWFSYLPVMCWLSRPVDPLADFIHRRTQNKDVQLLVLEDPILDAPVPDKLKHWLHTLLWCSNDAFPYVDAHLLACRLSDPPTPGLFHITAQDSTIPDVLALQQVSGQAPQRVLVRIYGISNPITGKFTDIQSPMTPHKPLRLSVGQLQLESK